MPAAEIPSIDLTVFSSEQHGSVEARTAVAAALNDAAEQVGFFYVSLPGLAEAADRLLDRCCEFHAQPTAVKQAVSNELSPMRRGYNATWETETGSCAAKPGLEPPDPKEVFMLGSEGDVSPMHGPNLWPDEFALPGWREAVERDTAVMLHGARCLAVALAAALGEPEGTFDEAMREPPTVLILLRYDPSKLKMGSSTGCGAHTDCGFLTFLAQQPGSAPVQVQRGALGAGKEHLAGASDVDEEAWVEAPHKEGHVLVNLGDLVARWTNGRYRSTVHRVVLEPGDARPPRHSCAFFANPTFSANVDCLPTCCEPSPGRPRAQFEPISAGRYMFNRLGLMYQENDKQTS